MSFDLNKNVDKSNHLTGFQLKFFGFIYCFNVKTIVCKVSFGGLALGPDVERSAAQVAIKRLEHLGWINVIHGALEQDVARNECNIYKIKRWPIIQKAKPLPLQPREPMTSAQTDALYLKSANRAGVDNNEALKLLIKKNLTQQLLSLECTYEGLKKPLQYHNELREIKYQQSLL